MLIDEISLADDSVVERLNSVLEEGCKLVLPEKPNLTDANIILEIAAHEKFRVCATMNPSGDFGKKELSPALRNRFLEIWCPSTTAKDDIRAIVTAKLERTDVSKETIDVMVEFIDWIRETVMVDGIVSVRDVIAWCEFIRNAGDKLPLVCSVIHGTSLVFLDGLQCYDLTEEKVVEIKCQAEQFLRRKFNSHSSCSCFEWLSSSGQCQVSFDEGHFQVGAFKLKSATAASEMQDYLFSTKSVTDNAFRVLRGLQSDKPLLLEGPPGAGKSVLVNALARVTGNKLVRINLSDQTDLNDLFGSDLPSKDEAIGSFSWHDGPVLTALKQGSWILFDELNLATQSVLEGLNACLDHRGEIFIAELNKTFSVKNQTTKVFATQNPSKDGSGRKSLPKSFLNRFSKVYVKSLDQTDIVAICHHRFSNIPVETISVMSKILEQLENDLSKERKIGFAGAPWQMNLRDLMRWCEGVSKHYAKKGTRSALNSEAIVRLGKLVLAERFRTQSDQCHVMNLLESTFQCQAPKITIWYANEQSLKVGSAVLSRSISSLSCGTDYILLQEQIPILESLMLCADNRWIPILVGDSGAGKTALVECLAQLAGQNLQCITLSASSDTSDLLGSFEQSDIWQRVHYLCQLLQDVLGSLINDEACDLSLIVGILQFVASVGTSDLPLSTIVLRLKEEFAKLETTAFGQCQILDPIRKEFRALDNLSLDSNMVIFKWIDSVLVNAVQTGKWIVIDNANFCCASVLDRLNGLFEPGGVLSIGEQGCTEGDVRTVKPHENFRIFLTMNQKFGELSPAMRNRGVEIFVDESYSDESLLQICQSQCPNLTPEQIVRVTQERLTQQGRTNLQKPSLRELKSLFSALRLESQLSGVIGGITHNHRTIQTISEMSLRPLASQAVAQVQILFKFLQKDQQKYGLAGVLCFLKLATNVDVGMRKRLLNDVFNLNTQVLEDLLSIMRKALKNNTPLDAHLLRVEKDLDADSKTSDKILLAMFQKLADMQIPADSASVDFDVQNIQEGFKDSLPNVMSAFSTDFDYIETWRLIHAVTWFKAKIFSLPSSVDTIEAAIRLGWIVLKEHFENSTLWNNCFFGQHAAVLSCTLISQSMAMIHSGFEGEPPLTSLAQVEAFKALLEASYKLRPSAIKDIAVLQPTLKALANYNNDPSNINLEIALAEKCDTKKAELFLNQILLKDLVISFFNSLRSDPRDMKHSELHDLRFRELVANAKNNNRLSSLLLAVQKQLHQIQTPVMIQLLQKSSSSEDVEMSDPSLANRTTMSVSSLMAPVFLADSKCSLFHQEISMKLLRKAREILVSSYLVSKRYLEQKSELALNNAEEDFEKIIRAFRDQIANATSISDEDFKNNLVKLFRREKSIPDGIASLLESCFRLKEKLLSLKALPSNRRKTAIVINVKSRLQIASSLILFWMVTDECSSDIREKADAKLDLLRTETSNSVSVLQTERSCVTLSYYTGSEGLAHHSHHQALSKVVNDNVNLERKIEADLPIRGEPQKQLEAELSVMQKGLFSPAYVQTLVEEIKSHKNVEYIMKRVTNWTHSLTKFMDDVALNFPSFVDMWSLSSYAMVEAIKGVEVLLGESNAEREGGIKIEIMDHITTAREQKQRLVLYHAIEVDGTIVAAGQEGSAESLETSGQSLTVLHRLSDEISFSQQPTEDEESNPSPIGHFFRQLGSKSVGLQIEPKETLNLYLNILAKISGSHYVDPKVEISFLSSHVRAIDQTLNELTKRDAEMDDLNEIVMHLLTLKSRVNEDLLSQWPENQLLIDIVRGIDEIGGHSVHDSRAEFLVAFETLGEKIAEWNKGAPSHLAVDRTRIAKQVETWKLKEYKDTSKTFERLRSNLLKDTLKAGFKLFKIVDSIRISKRNVDKRRYVVTTLGLFISSANLVDFEARLQIVQAMAEYFRLCDRPISRNIQEVAAYFEQYLAQFKEIFKNCKAGIAKNVTTVMKSFNQKDLRSYKQFINQKKKLGGDSAETMSAKVSKLNSEHDVKSRLTQPEPLLIALEDCQIQFRDGLDNLMGDTKQMLAKADVSVKNLKNRFSALSEEKAGELEELRVTLERSTDKYLCTKMVEGLMKDLKGEGLSFRIGNMTNVSARNLLTTATKESRESLSVLNACLSETDLLRSILTDPKARKNHISARFPPQALGLTSHGLVKVFKANFDFSREALEASQFDCLVERLKAFATIDGKVSKEQKIHDRILEQSIGEIIFVLKEQLNSNGLSSSVKHSIESTISNLAELCSKLEKNLCSSLAIKDEIQKLEKISLEKFCESHNLAEVRSATKNILSRLQRSVKSEEEKAKKVSVSSEATEKMEVFAKKCLLSVQELKRAIDNLKKQKELKDEQDIDENAEDDSVFKALEICRDLFKAFHSSSRTRELGNIVRYLEFCSDSGLNLGSSKSYALEILAVCSMFQSVFFWLLKTLQTTGVIAQKYLYTIIKIFIAYIGKEFSQNDQPESKEGDQEDQKDGCGLGEGKGDKATLDGVEDEDLFENEPKEGKEEEEEEKEENDKDEEQDPAVDFSQDMGGTNKDEDPKDEDASDDEEDERDKDDIENVERDEINNEQEEELRPDDWDEEEDDGAEENEDEKEKKEDEEKERHAPDTTGQEDEQCSDNDIDAEEEEPRTRHPDEVDEEAIDDHMEDEQYGQEPEIECEDMDLPEDMNMGDEDEEEVVMEDEKLGKLFVHNFF